MLSRIINFVVLKIKNLQNIFQQPRCDALKEVPIYFDPDSMEPSEQDRDKYKEKMNDEIDKMRIIYDQFQKRQNEHNGFLKNLFIPIDLENNLWLRDNIVHVLAYFSEPIFFNRVINSINEVDRCCLSDIACYCIKNKVNETPLDIAIKNNNIDLISALHSDDLKSFIPEYALTYPLHLACQLGNKSMIENLLSYPNYYSLESKNQEGQTPIDVAHATIKEFLLQINNKDVAITNFSQDNQLETSQKGDDLVNMETSMEKRYIVLICYNMEDGSGDFGHGISLYQALKKDTQLNSFEVIYITAVDENKYNRLYKTFSEHFSNEHNAHIIKYSPNANSTTRGALGTYLDTHPNLRTQLERAEILISASTPAMVVELEKHAMHQPHLTVVVAEHNGTSLNTYRIPNTNSVNTRIMGVGDDQCGLFVEKISLLDMAQKIQILQKMNSYFVEQLTGKKTEELNDESLTEWLSDTLIIPSYLHYGREPFIKAIGTNKFIKEKNIIIYINQYDGFNLDLKNSVKEITTYLIENNIGRVEFNFNGEIYTQVNENLPEGKTIKIMTNFSLNDHDYEGLYQLATLLSGVGGDKTLEKTISHGLLIWYAVFTKPGMVKNIVALACQHFGIDESELELAKYLNAVYKSAFGNDVIVKELANMDLYLVRDQWEKVQNVIINNHNLYSTLPNIIQESLFYAAVIRGDLDEIKRLITYVDLNMKDRFHHRPIIKAFIKNNTKTFKILLKEELNNTNDTSKLENIYQLFQDMNEEIKKIIEYNDELKIPDEILSEQHLFKFGKILQKAYLTILEKSNEVMLYSDIENLTQHPHYQFIKINMSPITFLDDKPTNVKICRMIEERIPSKPVNEIKIANKLS